MDINSNAVTGLSAKNQRLNFGYTISTLLLISVFLTGCGFFVDESELLKQAKQHQTERDHRTAIVKLKKIIKTNAENKRARLLLAESYLAIEQAASAEKELLRAKRLGATDTEIMVNLSRALLMQGAYGRIFSETPLTAEISKKQKIELSLIHGYAYLSLGSKDRARDIFNEINDSQQGSADALIALAMIAMSSEDAVLALKLVNQAVELDSKNSKAWMRKAQIHMATKDFPKAKSSFEKVISLGGSNYVTKNQFAARVSLIQIALAQKDLSEAEKNLASLKKVAVNHPVTLYFSGVMAFQQKKYEEARLALESALTKAPNYLRAQLLLGSVYFAQRNYEQANELLSRYVNQVPDNIQARKILGSVQIKLGQHNKALKLLKEAELSAGNDAGLLAMIGEASVLANQMDQAEIYLKKASKAMPTDKLLKEELAKLYLKQGSVEQAITELESVKGGGSAKSKQMLVYAHLRKKNFQAARKIAKDMIKENPTDPQTYLVAGTVEKIAGKNINAKRYFEKSLTVDGKFVPAILLLARLDIDDNNIDEAVQKYNQALILDENNVKAMLGLAQIAGRRGDEQQAISWVEKANSKNPDSLEPIMILGRYYVKIRQNDKALALAQKAAVKHGNKPFVQSILTTAYLRVGKKNAALDTANKMVKTWPNLPATHFDLARVQDSLGQYDAAKLSLKTTLKLEPKFLLAKSALAMNEMKTNNFNAALRLAVEIERDHPKLPAGLVIKGDIYMLKNEYRNAQLVYEKAAKVQNSSALTIKSHIAYAKDNKLPQGIKILAAWYKKNPEDMIVKFELANAYGRSGQDNRAIKLYEELLVSKKDNALVLNNYASLLIDSKPAQALKYAEQAYKLLQNNPGVADTYGWILLKQGKLEQGLPILKAAASKSEHPSIQYHYAVALEKRGAKQQAKTVLENILRRDVQFEELKEAKALNQSL